MDKQEALEEEQYRKMAQTPVPRLIISLSIPTIISMLVTNIYNTADTYFVSRLGTSAAGAVGIVFALMAFYQAVGFTCGHGSGSFVSRLYGEKEPEKAFSYGNSAFLMSLVLGAVISVVCFCFLNPLLMFLGSTETILPYARQYAFWILLAGPLLSASCTLNNLLRYEGRAFYAMIGLTVGGIMNMAGDPIFMFVFKMGVSGAGLSTALSQLVSFLILLSMFFTDRTVMKFRPAYVSRTRSIYTDVLKIGSPSLARQGLSALSTILLNRAAKPYGDPAIAAMSIVGRLAFFIAAVGIGMGQGLQPVASFNFGAGKYSRVKEGTYFTTAAGTLAMSVFAILVLIFTEPIITWFRDDPEVIAIGTVALRYQCLSSFFMPASFCANMLFQSVGRAREAFTMACMRTGIFYIPLILLLPRALGITGIEITQPIADLLTAAVSIFLALRFMRSLPEDRTEA